MKTPNILLVFPKGAFSKTLKDKLEPKGYSISGATNYQAAVQLYQTEQPDLILLGIQLKGHKTGIHFAQFIQTQFDPPPFIYLMAERETTYLPMAKLTLPAACLIQPFNQATLLANLEIVLHGYQQQKRQEAAIKVFDGTANQQITIKDILFIKADHVYVEIFTKRGKMVIRSTLQAILNKLPTANFVRTHRSYIVNMKHVSSWGRQHLHIEQHQIPLSRSLQKNVFRSLAQS